MTSPGRLHYLPALDGLRALAVIGVLFFHAGYGWASGGFLGVSAFFTLSGFLIATLLLREFADTGQVDLKGFWLRRVRRLLPALILAALGILLFVATVGSTQQADSVGADGPWAMLYLANWRFIFEGQSYTELFNGDATSPLLHLWSLAIEEQFYVIMPLLAAALGLGTKVNFRRRLGIATAVGLAASFGSMIYLSATDADLSRLYYGTDVRAAEILIGVGGAVLVDGRRSLLTKRAGASIATVGALAIAGMAGLWAVTSETSEWLNRGGFSVHAVLMLVVILAAAPPGPFATALSRPWLLYIGRVSYGLYLFHWPIYLWLTPERTGFDDFRLAILRMGLSLFAATASYLFIEQPIRSGRVAFGPLPLGIVALLAALFATLPASAKPSDVVFEAITPPSAIIELEADAGTEAVERRPVMSLAVGRPELFGPAVGIASALADDSFAASVTDAAQALPTAEVRTGPARVMLVGDSVMLTLGRGFERLALEDDGIEVLNAAKIGCPIGQGGVQRIYGRELDEFTHCRHEHWEPLLEAWDPDVVVLLSGVWDLKERKLDEWGTFLAPGDPVFDEWLLAEYEAAIDTLGSTGAEVVVVRPACLSRTDQNGNAIEEDEFTPGRLDAYNEAVIDEVAESTLVFDLNDMVCGTDGDPAVDWAGLADEVRPDGVHFGETSSRVIAQLWRNNLVTLAGTTGSPN